MSVERGILNRINDRVIESGPRILRPGGLAYGVAAAVDRSFVVAGLSLGVGFAAAFILEARRRAAKKRR